MSQVAVARAPDDLDEMFAPDTAPRLGAVPASRFRHILVPTDLTSRTTKCSTWPSTWQRSTIRALRCFMLSRLLKVRPTLRSERSTTIWNERPDHR